MRNTRSNGASLGDGFDLLLEGAREGDHESWSSLYQALAGRVAGYLRMQGAVEPEDLTSEVFLAIFRNISSFSGGEAQFRSWVFVIAHRRLIDERRRNGRRDEVPLDDDVSQVVAGDAEDDAMYRLGNNRAIALLDRLVADQRDVLTLRLVADLTVEQAADVLGKSPGAVKALQRRGLAALGRLSQKEGVTL